MCRLEVHKWIVDIQQSCHRYLVDAFEAGAIDYLLKPVSHERLAAAVARARRLTSASPTNRGPVDEALSSQRWLITPQQ